MPCEELEIPLCLILLTKLVIVGVCLYSGEPHGKGLRIRPLHELQGNALLATERRYDLSPAVTKARRAAESIFDSLATLELGVAEKEMGDMQGLIAASLLLL